MKNKKKTKQAARELLKDDNVKRWYKNTCRGSKLNADIRLRRLNLFCYTTDTTPAKLASVGKKDAIAIENILLDHVSWLESQNYSPNYIDGILKAIKSWLSYNYIELKRKIRITNAGVPVNIQDEIIPTKEILKSIIDVANPRTRASISLMAFSGLRPQVMGNADATDGLKLSDLPELTIDDSKISFTCIPAMIIVKAALSKTRNKYITFLSREGCEYVLGYLRKRIAGGEKLHADSPLIALKKGYELRGNFKNSLSYKSHQNHRFITTPRITAEIRDAIWSITKARPYVLRAYFDTQLLLAESNGKMTHAYRQFFMGHKGDIEARYTTNKGRLTDEMITDMRRAFLQSESFLCTNQSNDNMNQQSKKEMFLEMWQEQAKMYGIDPMKLKIEKQRTTNTNNDDDIKSIIDAIQQEILQKINPTTCHDEKQFQSKIVSADDDNHDELMSFIENGWKPVKELSCNRIIIKKKRR